MGEVHVGRCVYDAKGAIVATLTVRKITDAGLDEVSPAWDSAAGGGDDFPNNGNTYVAVNNGSGGAITVTVPIGVDPHASDPLHATTDSTVSLSAGQRKYIGPFDKVKYGNSVGIEYSAATSVTVAAFSI